MEIQGKNIIIGETVADMVSEKTLEGEIIIPDYLTDAVRVIKTECSPRIISKRKSEDKICIDVAADVRIWYYSEEGKVALILRTENYTEEFNIKECQSSICLRTATKTEYANGGTIHSRKLSYKVVVSTSVRCYFRKETKIVTDEQAACMECEQTTFSFGTMAAATEKNISVSDVIEVMSGKGEIKEILKSEAVVYTGDMKPINNKIIMRGHVDVKILYISVEGKIETVRAEIPFTQIIDIDGMDEECIADLRYTVNGITATPKTDENGLMKHITVDVELLVLARGYKNSEYTVSSDAYSMAYKCELELNEVEAEHFDGKYNALTTERGTIESSDTIISVSDVSATVYTTGILRENGVIKVKCAVNCTALAENSNKEPIVLNKRFETVSELEIKSDAKSVRVEPDAKISSISYSISGDNRIDIKYDINVDALVFSSIRGEIVSAAKIDESAKIERKNSSPLVIYYAKKGDKIFNIAKAYRTSSRAISEANSLTESVLSEDKTIIIPIIKA